MQPIDNSYSIESNRALVQQEVKPPQAELKLQELLSKINKQIRLFEQTGDLAQAKDLKKVVGKFMALKKEQFQLEDEIHELEAMVSISEKVHELRLQALGQIKHDLQAASAQQIANQGNLHVQIVKELVPRAVGVREDETEATKTIKTIKIFF